MLRRVLPVPLFLLSILLLLLVPPSRRETTRTGESASGENDVPAAREPDAAAPLPPSRLLAPQTAAPALWQVSRETAGDEAGLRPALAAEARGRNELPEGRRWKLTEPPDWRGLVEGARITVPLPDGRAFSGTVVWSRRDTGYADTHIAGIYFDGGKGSLNVAHDAVTGQRSGRLLVQGDRLAWTFRAAEAEPAWLVEHLREDLLCELPAPVASLRQDPLPGDPNPPPPAVPATPPIYNSRPGAAGILYLDFDGQPPAFYPDWFLQVGILPYAVPHSGLSTGAMDTVWRRVAEDFIPFNVNVTTDASLYAAAPVGRRMRVLIGATLPSGLPGGGVAQMRSFRAGVSFSSDVPCWVRVDAYTNGTELTGDISSMAVAVSHEFGHTMGLWHDGNDGMQPTDTAFGNYYNGHGTPPFDWSPIMGTSFRNATGSECRGVVQWSMNSYPGANNSQDDMAVLAGAENGVGYVADESTGVANAVTLTPVAPGDVGGTGVIHGANDQDWWRFTVPYTGFGTVEMAPAEPGLSLPNLDCGFRILDHTGANFAGPFSRQDDLEVREQVYFTPGTYYVVAYGTGNRQASDGYTNYGSAGRYVITVIQPEDSEAPLLAITSPANNSVLSSTAIQFQGTASDNEGFDRVELALRRESDGTYWNGSYWQTGRTGGAWLANAYNATAGTWTCTATLPAAGGTGPNVLTPGNYMFQAFAYDSEGNYNFTEHLVSVDAAGPGVTITAPLSGSLLGAPGFSFTGTATENGVLQYVVGYIRRNSDGQYWNGSAWQSGTSGAHLACNTVQRPETTIYDWTCTATLPALRSTLTAGDSYNFIAIAVDGVGLSRQVDAVVNVDGTPPATAITAPAHNGVINSGAVPFHGTITDNAGVWRVVCFIRRHADSLYWDGGAWIADPGAANLSASYNAGAGTWTCTATLPLPGGALENGGYNFIAIGFDHAGNTHQVDSVVTVDYHQIYVWNGSAGGAWENAGSWTPNGVPGAEDYVVISNGGTVTNNAVRTVYGFRLSNGTMTSSEGNSLTFTHDSTWTGGTIGGVWNSAAGAVTVVSGSPVKYFNPSTTINNHGLVEWRGGERMVAWNNTGTPITWNNHGVFRISADDTVFSRQYTTVTPVFNNLTGGRIEKTAGSGIIYWYYWTLNNASDLFLNSGGMAHYYNTVNLDPGSALMGGGTLWLNTSVNLRADLFATAAVNFTGGYISCTDTMRTWTGPGVLNWTEGTLYGRLTRAAGTYTILDGSDTKTLADAAELVNEGTVSWTGTGNFTAVCSGSTGPVVRNSGGWTVSGGADLVRQGSAVHANFHNEAGGTFTKLNTATTHSTWRWHNAGAVNINQGWLEWHQNGTHSGTFSIASDCWLHLFAGTHSMADNTPFNGSGNVLVNGATVNAAGVLYNNLGGGFEHRAGWISQNPQLRGPGLWKWTGGGISGTASLGAGCNMEIYDRPNDARSKEFYYNTTFDNHGTFIWQGGSSIISNNTSGTPLTFNNHSIVRAAADGTIWSRQGSSTTSVFNNLPGARFEKTGGTGTLYWYYWTLNSESEIALPSGGLYFNLNRVNFHDGTAFTGTGFLYLNTDAYLYAADIQSTVTLDWRGGSLSSVSGSTRTWAGQGPFLWTGGTLYGSLKLAAGVTASLSGTEIKELAVGAELINEGTLTWTGTGNITGNSTASPGAVIRNRGTFLADTGSDIVPTGTAVVSNFYNEAGATFTKTNPGTTYSTWQFHNAGTVNINEGWLEWHRNGTHTGTFEIAANCWLHIFAGTHSMADGTPFSGAGNVLVNGATVNAAGVLMNNLGGGFEHRAGWLSVNPQFRGSGLWKWTGGGISGTASLGAGCTMEVYDRPGAEANKEFYYNTTFDNYGTFIWQGGSSIVSNNSSGTALVFNNHSIVRATADGTIWSRQGSSTTSVFNNLPGARFEKTGGTGTLYWYYWTLNNETDIAVENGGLYFYVNRTNLREGSAFNGTGIVYLRTDAYLYANRLHATTDTRFIGVFLSAVGGTRTWAGPGPFSWTEGTLYGSLKLEAGVLASLSGADTKVLAVGAELINEGTITWTGTGLIVGDSTASPGAVIRNRGTFLADTPADIVPTGTTALSNFYNEAGATFTKTDPGTTYSTWQFHNAGTININEGWLEWHRNGTHTGTFNIVANCWLHVFAGTHSMADGTPFNGSGNVLINGATVNAAGVLLNNLGGGVEHRAGWISVNPQLRGSGLWKWTGGGISGTASLGAGCNMEIYDRPGDARSKEFYFNTTFDNHGTFIWQGGSSIISNNTSGTPLTFNNHSIVRAAADGTIWSRQGSSTTSVFNNLPGARFEKTGGDGTLYWYYWTLNNETDIAVQDGGLYFYVNRTNLHEGSAFTGAGVIYLRTDAYLYANRLHATTDTRFIGVFLSAEGGTRTWAGPGPFTWTEGTLYGSLKLEAGVNATLSGTESKEFAPGAELINEGTVTMSGTGVIIGRTQTGTVTIRNRPGALWRQDTTAAIQWQSSNNRGLFENAGSVEIGAGVFYLNGWNFTQTGTGAIYSDLTDTGHDQIYVYNAPVTAAGVLHVRRAPGFTPPQGTNYNILTGTGRSGTFASVTGGFTADYQPTLARVTPQPPAEDFSQWIAAAGFSGDDALRTADPDKDGADNFTEFAFRGNPALAGDPAWARDLEEIDGEQWLTLPFRRWEDREQSGVVYEPAASADLGTWGLTGLVEEPDLTAPPVSGSTAWRARIRLGGEARFLRVTVRDASP